MPEPEPAGPRWGAAGAAAGACVPTGPGLPACGSGWWAGAALPRRRSGSGGAGVSGRGERRSHSDVAAPRRRRGRAAPRAAAAATRSLRLQRDDLALQLPVARRHLQRPLELHESRAQLAEGVERLPQESAGQDVVGRVAQRGLQLHPRPRGVAGVEQRSPERQPRGGVGRVLDQPRPGHADGFRVRPRPFGALPPAARTAATLGRARAGVGARRCGSQPRSQSTGAGLRSGRPRVRAYVRAP